MTHVRMMSLKLGKKTLSAHKGVIYQTKGKGPLYTSVQSDGRVDVFNMIYLLGTVILKSHVTRVGWTDGDLNSYLVSHIPFAPR